MALVLLLDPTHPCSTHRTAGKIDVNLILYKLLLRSLLANKQLSQKQTRKLQVRDATSMGVCALHKTEKNEEGLFMSQNANLNKEGYLYD